jgi:hypothetical protein
MSDTASQLRVFLSADLVGSTKLKNRLNHQELLAKYRARKHVVEKLRRADAALSIAENVEQTALLESLGVSDDDFDWATVVCSFYQGIHASFVNALYESKECGELEWPDLEDRFKPWKAVGDELIYETLISGRAELHLVTIAFLKAIREMDRKVSEGGGDGQADLRIKGAAWVAGFPVRNRRIELPPDNRPDYLGPDMDTGFRIGKCTRSGMLVVSAEMAELLGECQGRFAPMLSKIVGWEELKGVWNNQKYPVIWVDFPDSHPASESHAAKQFSIWEVEESSFCKAWEAQEAKRQLSDVAKTLRGIRSGLPKSLGLVDPYIIGDTLETGEINPDHQQILDLLHAIDRHRREANRQDAGPGATRDETLDQKKKSLRNLVQKRSRKNRG